MSNTAALLSHTPQKTHYYGRPRQLVGQELNSGLLVTSLSDLRLAVLHTQAWDLSDTHDLAVIEAEQDKRAGRYA